jgi:hypothetical protein
MTFTEEVREKLTAGSAATLTTVLLKRGLRNVFVHGVHKISMAQEVVDEAFGQTVFEDFVEDRVKAGRGIFGLYPPSPEAEAEFRDWRREKGR